MTLRLTILAACFLAVTLPIAANEDPLQQEVVSIIKGADEYIGWPEAKSGEHANPFFVAILGDSDLAAHIRELNRTKLPDGRKLRVRVIRDDLLPSNAHILITTLDDQKRVNKLLKKLSGTGTFTINIGDADINAMLTLSLVEQDGKPTIKASLDSALAAEDGLVIKPKLQKLVGEGS